MAAGHSGPARNPFFLNVLQSTSCTFVNFHESIQNFAFLQIFKTWIFATSCFEKVWRLHYWICKFWNQFRTYLTWGQYSTTRQLGCPEFLPAQKLNPYLKLAIIKPAQVLLIGHGYVAISIYCYTIIQCKIELYVFILL